MTGKRSHITNWLQWPHAALQCQWGQSWYLQQSVDWGLQFCKRSRVLHEVCIPGLLVLQGTGRYSGGVWTGTDREYGRRVTCHSLDTWLLSVYTCLLTLRVAIVACNKQCLPNSGPFLWPQVTVIGSDLDLSQVFIASPWSKMAWMYKTERKTNISLLAICSFPSARWPETATLVPSAAYMTGDSGWGWR